MRSKSNVEGLTLEEANAVNRALNKKLYKLEKDKSLLRREVSNCVQLLVTYQSLIAEFLGDDLIEKRHVEDLVKSLIESLTRAYQTTDRRTRNR